MPDKPEDAENNHPRSSPSRPRANQKLPFKTVSNVFSGVTRPSTADGATSPLRSTNENGKRPRSPERSPDVKRSASVGKPKQLSLLETLKKIKPKSQGSSSSSSTSSEGKKKNTDYRNLLKRSASAQSVLDDANKDWLQSPLTPSKHARTEKGQQYDRFIPNREQMDITASQFLLQSETKSLDQDTLSYQEHVAAVVGITPGNRILAFRPEPPQSNHAGNETTRRAAVSTTRRIPTAPEKILDAPCMTDDYYLNLLDWSSKNVVAIALDRSVYLWNADNGSITALNYQSREDDGEYVASLSWSNDGAYLAVGTSLGDTQIWDVERNMHVRTMRGQQGRVGSLSWAKHLVASGAYDGSIWHHDVRVANDKVAELHGHEQEVCGLKWRWDGLMLASGGNDNIVNIWDARSTTPKYQKDKHIGAIKALAWCPWNDNLLATGGGRADMHIHFWNTTSGARTNSIFTGSQVTSLIWSRHHKELLSTHGLPNNHLTIWAYPTLNKIIDIPAHDSRILHSALSPDGAVVATAAADENLKFWRVFDNDGKELSSGRSNGRYHQLQLQRSKSSLR